MFRAFFSLFGFLTLRVSLEFSELPFLAYLVSPSNLQ